MLIYINTPVTTPTTWSHPHRNCSVVVKVDPYCGGMRLFLTGFLDLVHTYWVPSHSAASKIITEKDNFISLYRSLYNRLLNKMIGIGISCSFPLIMEINKFHNCAYHRSKHSPFDQFDSWKSILGPL